MEPEERAGSPSRRDFLKGVGATGAGLVAGTLGTGTAGAATGGRIRRPAQYSRAGTPLNPADFGRMFPKLPPFAEANDTVRAALVEVGKQGGILDAKDDLTAGGKRLIVDPTVNGNPTADNPYGSNPDNPTMTAGSTFVGQFIDHDITFDQTSQLGVPQDPTVSPNTRTPLLDLDSVFGGGPGVRPDLYEPNADGTVGPKLKIGSGGVHEDVPRIAHDDGTFDAVLGDPRNDEHRIIAGLHCAHILFYNRVLDELDQLDLRVFPSAQDTDTSHRYMAFRVAREVTLWHYQWLVVNEHLPQICGQAVVNDILKRGPRFYRPAAGQASMPIEFGGAAYRFGHSMVRPSYRLNFSSGTGDSSDPTKAPFFGLVFDPNEIGFTTNSDGTLDRNDFVGGFPSVKGYVGWQTFFDFGDGQVKPNKKIDPLISSELFALPSHAIAPHTEPAPLVLTQRNLLRQLTWGLPSGQAVARAMGVAPLSAADLSDIASVYAPFGTSTPLWYYVLAEAKAATNGITLGPVGGRIVAETLIGLLLADPTSYLSVRPKFQPFLGADLPMGPNPNPNITGNRDYTRAHFLYYARVAKPGTYR
jgi:heme peroxidase